MNGENFLQIAREPDKNPTFQQDLIVSLASRTVKDASQPESSGHTSQINYKKLTRASSAPTISLISAVEALSISCTDDKVKSQTDVKASRVAQGKAVDWSLPKQLPRVKVRCQSSLPNFSPPPSPKRRVRCRS